MERPHGSADENMAAVVETPQTWSGRTDPTVRQLLRGRVLAEGRKLQMRGDRKTDVRIGQRLATVIRIHRRIHEAGGRVGVETGGNIHILELWRDRLGGVPLGERNELGVRLRGEGGFKLADETPVPR